MVYKSRAAAVIALIAFICELFVIFSVSVGTIPFAGLAIALIALSLAVALWPVA